MSGLNDIQRQKIADTVVGQLRDIPPDLLPSLNLGSMILDAFIFHVPKTQYHPMELVLVRALFDVLEQVQKAVRAKQLEQVSVVIPDDPDTFNRPPRPVISRITLHYAEPSDLPVDVVIDELADYLRKMDGF